MAHGDMKVRALGFPGVRLIRPRVFRDARGWFLETWQAPRYRLHADMAFDFVQHNQSGSVRGVVRGLHFQVRHPQGKLIRVVQGHIWDVMVDLRRDSPCFGQWQALELHGPDCDRDGGVHEQLWLPPGMAHGFAVLSESAVIEYLCTTYYDASDDYCLRWDDAQLGIDWPVAQPLLSARDGAGYSLAQLQAQDLLPRATVGESSGDGSSCGNG